jgi:hypothetical protein
MAKYYDATIEWLDNGDVQTVTFKDGDPGEDDDDVFFYIDGVHELESLKTVGIAEFVVVDYFEVLNYKERLTETLPNEKFLIKLEFQGLIYPDQTVDIQQKIMDALVSWVDNGPGFAPEETITKSISVIDSDGREKLHLFKIS